MTKASERFKSAHTNLSASPTVVADEGLDEGPLGAVLLHEFDDERVLLLREGALLARLGLLAAGARVAGAGARALRGK